jgi:hypothetical protein
VAARKYIVPQTQTLTYLLGDHLGSISLAVDTGTGQAIETRYKAWGEVRHTTPDSTLPTRYTFTGQYSYVADAATDLGSSGFGLMYYNARCQGRFEMSSKRRFKMSTFQRSKCHLRFFKIGPSRVIQSPYLCGG